MLTTDRNQKPSIYWITATLAINDKFKSDLLALPSHFALSKLQTIKAHSIICEYSPNNFLNICTLCRSDHSYHRFVIFILISSGGIKK